MTTDGGPTPGRSTGRPRRFGLWLVALVLASGLPLIALSVALVTTSALGQRQQVLDGLESTAAGLQRAIDAELRIWVASLQTLAASPALDAVLAAGPDAAAARAAFHAEASDLVARGGGSVVNAVLFAVPDGRQIVNTFVPPDAPLPTVAAVEPPPARAKAGPPLDPTRAFAEVTARGTPYVSDLLVGPVTRRLLVTVAAPVLRDGRVVALLTLSVAPDGFNAVLTEGGLTPGAIAAVVDRAGVIVGRSRDAARYVGQFGVDDVRRFQNDPEARTARLRMNTVDGQAVYGVMRRLETAPWSVVYGAPQATVDAPLRRELVYGGGAGLLALAVFVAAALWQGRRLGREMAALGADAAAVGRGRPCPCATTASPKWPRCAPPCAAASPRWRSGRSGCASPPKARAWRPGISTSSRA